MRLHRAAALLVLAACGPAATKVDPNGMMLVPPVDMIVPPPPPRYTYYRDVKPILDARCGNCHRIGGIGPFPIGSYQAASTWKDPIKEEVSSKRMPPWHADDACASYANDRSLSILERATLIEWVESGAPEGAAADEPAPLSIRDPGLSRVDAMIPIESDYVPAKGDDYRCFAIRWDQPLTNVTGYNLVPTTPAEVHHANIYLVGQARGQSFLDRQSADAAAGYRCFGGVFEQGVSVLGSWAPGSHGVDFPAGAGIEIPTGSVIVIEMHYNTDAITPAADRSALHLKLDAQVRQQGVVAPFYNFFDWPNPGGMPIPAGMNDAMHTFTFDPGPWVPTFAPWIQRPEIKLHTTGLHMHFLGRSGKLEILRANGTKECLLDIPRWDFHWQSSYQLAAAKPFVLGQDRVRLECHWDNSPEHQPVIDGVVQPPRDVEWGSNSTDEMCIGYLFLTQD